MSEEFKKAKKRTFYDVLGIPQDANSQTIKSAYYHMARRFHPDKNPETSDIFLEIKEAYSTLIDESQRLKYDAIQSNIYIKTEDAYASNWRSTAATTSTSVSSSASFSSSTENVSNTNSSNEDSGNESRRKPSSSPQHINPNNSNNSCDSRECSDDGNEADHDEVQQQQNYQSQSQSNVTEPTMPRRRRRTRRSKPSQQPPQSPQSQPASQPAVGMRPAKPDVEISLDLTLDDIYNGCIKCIDYEKYDACPNCKGFGCLRTFSCIECKGTGQVSSKRCTLCKGMGEFPLTQEKCPVCCGGCFSKQAVKDFRIEIPAGISENSVLQFHGQGNYVPTMKDYGALVVRIREVPHPVYRRDGADLLTDVRLSLRDALCGYSLNIAHLNGKSFSVKSPQGKITRPNDLVVVKGLGLPVYGDQKGKLGNLIIKLMVDFPPDGFFPQESIDLLNQILI